MRAQPQGRRRAGAARAGSAADARVPRYPSDMGNGERAVIEPALPEPGWMQGRGGRPAQHCRRDILDAIRYLVKEGISWRAMPADFPPWPRVFGYLRDWQASGATERMHGQLRDACRIAAGRTPGPTAAIIDSQSVKAAEEVARPAAATTRARRSTAASGTSPWTCSACC